MPENTQKEKKIARRLENHFSATGNIKKHFFENNCFPKIFLSRKNLMVPKKSFMLAKSFLSNPSIKYIIFWINAQCQNIVKFFPKNFENLPIVAQNQKVIKQKTSKKPIILFGKIFSKTFHEEKI